MKIKTTQMPFSWQMCKQISLSMQWNTTQQLQTNEPLTPTTTKMALHSDEWKNPDTTPPPKIAHTLRFHLDKVLGNANLSRVTENRWLPGRKRPEGLQKGKRKFLGVMGMFIILTGVLVSWLYTRKTHQIIHFKHVQFTVWQPYLNKAVWKREKDHLKEKLTHLPGLVYCL